MDKMTEFILEVNNLKKYFPLDKNLFGKPARYLKAVDNVSFKLKTHHIVPEKTQSVTMAHFSGGTGTPEDNVGYSFHDTIADEIFNGALLRGESPLVALHELEKRTNLMAIRAAFDGADEFTTDMSDYEREEDYGL